MPHPDRGIRFYSETAAHSKDGALPKGRVNSRLLGDEGMIREPGDPGRSVVPKQGFTAKATRIDGDGQNSGLKNMASGVSFLRRIAFSSRIFLQMNASI